MSTKTETVPSKLDPLKWIVVVLLFSAAVGGNVYFAAEPLLYRVTGVIILSLIALVVGLQTEQGKAFSGFFKDARIELKKIIWPTQQETLQSTLIVVVVVFFMALVLFFLDWGLSALVGMVLG